MTSRPVLEPSTEHPITINPTQARVVVHVNGEVVAAHTPRSAAAGVHLPCSAIHSA